MYTQAALSPDGSRVAVIKNDPATGTSDVLVLDAASGKAAPITSDAAPNTSPVWSPDGKQIAYVSVIASGNYSAVYRKASDGSGDEELLYKHTPSPLVVLTDWSADGGLCFCSDSVTYALPLNGDRQAVRLFSGRGGLFSPDGRFIAYSSDESGRFELYVAPFGPSGASRSSTRALGWVRMKYAYGAQQLA